MSLANIRRGIVSIVLFAVSSVAAGPSPAAGQARLSGTWRGDLNTPAGALTIVVSLSGGPTGTLAVPARDISDIPVTEVVLGDGESVSFRVPADRAAFEGRLESATRLVGEWVQAGQRVPLQLTRVAEGGDDLAVRARPQTPAPPFAYSVEEVTVAASERLACTLTVPRPSQNLVPAAVLLTVAGPNDRDQTHNGHKPFMVLADHLARNGVAALRCDDRGVGSSGGEVLESTIDELVADALAMVGYLKALDGIGHVGVIGNSEGSVVGSLAAADQPDQVAFAVLLGGVGVLGSDLIRARLVNQALAAGVSAEEVEAALAPFDALAQTVLEAGGVGSGQLKRADPELYASLVEVARTAGNGDPFIPADLDARVELFASAWYYDQLSLDGGEILTRVRAPVLALTGSKDRTNLPDQNLPAIQRALEGAGNADFQITEVPDLNHVFQTAEVGGLAEYGRLEESFAPVALDLITRWIRERFSAGATQRER